MSANLRAFLAMLRHCEGTADDAGYSRLVGGGNFSGWADHPRILKSGTFSNGVPWKSTAAGAYQFLSSTWDAARSALGLPDFSPSSQDEAAVWLIKRRGALPDVEAGRIAEAIEKCNREWASLPNSPYGQPTKSLAECLRIYAHAGGFLSAQPEQQPAGATPPVAASSPPPLAAEPGSPPAPEPAPAAPRSTVTVESTMPIPAALVTAGASLLFDVVSDLFRARGTKTATRNAEIIEKAGPALVGVAQAITGESKMEDAVRRVTENPADRQAYRLAIQDDMDRIIGVVERLSEMDEASRDRAAERIKGDDSMAAATPLLIHFALGLLAGVIVLLVGVMGLQTWIMADHKPQPELIVLFVSIVSTMLGIVGTIYAYRFGSSAGSKASGDAVRAIAEARK